ncbi:flagellar assembly protein A [Accumulibacter sp.]|uniref:flagellar assembly protein A n=1 Tax=Accumulibacter sp. TaxID=2053492 RepID=UPI0028C4D095|nr:flagellar assembly protein A [Accumulibacter sp.]
MLEHPTGSIYNLAGLAEGQIVLPRYIVRHDSGLHAVLSRVESAADFVDFVNCVVALGLYFLGLDYARFQSLLYDDPTSRDQEASDEVFFATGIVAFPPERQALYKVLRIERGVAVYLFEPVYLEPGVGRPTVDDDENGIKWLSDSESTARPECARLDVDEFVVSAWAKGVRFGLDLAMVQEGIRLDKAERRVVARRRPLVPGKDAEIIEQAPGLHRNNAPRQLADGKVNLLQFETRYPQVAAGIRLVKKIPRTLGVDGRDVTGEPLVAPLPKDFDLARMVGPGTRISREKDGEYLVTSVHGFLNIDKGSGQFSVADKIVSREGVSARTTGDLTLTGEMYEQYGEIQEKRVVTCRSITAYADVFGKIVSTGGVVRLKRNLVGGSASNNEGDIVVEGVASGATLTALHGCVTVKRADNCLILARQVVVEQATQCDIVADELRIEVAEACALAGKNIKVGVARSRRDVDNALLILLPDLSADDAKIAALQQERATLAKAIAGHQERAAALRSEREVARYLLLADKLRSGEASLSPEQEVGWRRLTERVAPTLWGLSQIAEAISKLDAELIALSVQIEEMLSAREQACSELACAVDRVEDETRISALRLRVTDSPLIALPSKELKVRLRNTDGAAKRLFVGSSGRFAWSCPAPGSRLDARSGRASG